MNRIIPIEKMLLWIAEEKELGSEEADSVVLATASGSGEVHSRVVAIREITPSGILFFTQKRSRKAKDLNDNPSASMTLWLPLRQREVVLDGKVEALSQDENQPYWETLPRERQLRFLSYNSAESFASLNTLRSTYEQLDKQFYNQKIPMGESYCGYCFVPHRIYFYTLGQDTFSEVIQYVLYEGNWNSEPPC